MIQSRLDPRVKPFAGYQPAPIGSPSSQIHSSPPTKSASSSSGSGTGTGSGTAISTNGPSSNSTPFPYSVLHPTSIDKQVKPVKEFGYGWSSSNTASTPLTSNRIPTSGSVSIVDTNPDPIIIRARSPSAPVHPTQATSPFGIDVGINTAPYTTPQYIKQSTGRVPFPGSAAAINASNGNGNDHVAQRYQSRGSPLNHYSSVPSLTHDREYTTSAAPPPSPLTRYSSTNVNQWRQGIPVDTVEEEGDGHIHQHIGYNTLSSSRSVPGLTQAMSTPTLAHDFTQSRNSTFQISHL